MPNFKIKPPKGSIRSNNGTTVKFEWSRTFGTKRTEQFTRVQKFVDSETLRCTAPYIPLKTGMLIKSGTLGTVIGSGEVHYIATYAAKQNDTATFRSYDAQRGGKFFERMKIDHKKEILTGAKKIQKGGA